MPASSESCQPGAEPGQPGESAVADPARAGVIDLLALICYGELSAFERLADDSKLAPTLADKVALARLASVEFGHVDGLLAQLRELGADPFAAMAPFRPAIDSFHAHTAPSDWLEGLVKAYVGDGLAGDFYVEIAGLLDPSTREVIVASQRDTGHADFVVDRVRAAIEREPAVAGRLALWGRRLMGEALSQAQRVAADRSALSEIVAGTPQRPGLDLAELGRMFQRLTERHVERMGRLGLDA